MNECAIGIRVHSGWGALVAVTGEPAAIEVINRQRIEIVDRKAAGAVQPYHFARELALHLAEKHIAKSAAAANQLAIDAMREVAERLRGRDYKVVRAAILLSSWRPDPTIEKILASHAMIHAAEGKFFRKSFGEACLALRIPIVGMLERDLEERAMSRLGKDTQRLKVRINGLGKTLGPPWTSDQKTATLAAMIALAEQDNS